MNLTFGLPPTTTPTPERVRLARVGVLTTFAAMGALAATFLSRLPSVRDSLAVTPSELATLIMIGALGALVGLMVTGWTVARVGTRAVLAGSALTHLFALVTVGASLEWGASALFATGHFLATFSFAFANVAMNAEAAEIERRMGRSVMPQFHAAFSVGMALALGVGALVSHAGLAPAWHFIGAGVLLTVLRLAITPAAAIDGTPEPARAQPGLGGPFASARAEYAERRVVLIGVIVFAASMTEMTAAQWMSLSLVDDFGQTEAIGDLVYWVFVVAMVTVRWYGAHVIDRLGRVVTLRASAVAAVAGLLLFAFTPTVWLAPVAALLWGVGAALAVPIGFSAAADDPRRAAQRVSAVASFSTIAGLLVPQVVGHLAEWVSLRHALLVVLAASVASFVLARAVRRDARLFGSRRAQERLVGSGLLRRDQASPAVAPGATTVNGTPAEPVVGE